MNAEFWRGRRVLITGHTGFKGSWLSLWLQMNGAQVIGYALPAPTDPNLFGAAHVLEGMESVEGDVRDLAHILSILDKSGPEIVIHMAAQSLVRDCYAHPAEAFATNAMGTVNVLEAIRRTSAVRVAVFVTTDKCYENNEWIWGYREIDRLGGRDPYASSKAAAELAVAAYRDSYFDGAAARAGTAVATARAGNVIGGGDWAKDRLVHDIINAFQAGRAVRLRYPSAVRPWQHVLEPLNGYLMLAERLWEHGPRLAGGWNFGPDDDGMRPVAWVVEKMAELWGGGGWQPDPGDHPHEARLLRLDCSKVKSELGWNSRLDLDTTLDWVVEWYRGYLEGADARLLTIDQIERYQALLAA